MHTSAPRWLERYDRPLIPISVVVRVLLGWLFIYMGVLKLGHPIEFLKQIHQYHMLPVDPPEPMNLIAVTLPWLEILCGIGLVLGIWTRAAAIVVALMLA
ncbi:MAG: DoxX family protein, partial [Planctomycetota bacterium]